LSARAVRRLQRLAWVRRSVGLLALGLVIAGVLLGSAGVTVAGFGLLIAYMVLLVVGAVWSVGGRLDRQAGAVQLTGVHDRFKEASGPRRGAAGGLQRFAPPGRHEHERPRRRWHRSPVVRAACRRQLARGCQPGDRAVVVDVMIVPAGSPLPLIRGLLWGRRTLPFARPDRHGF
jgi:hypothetical protein